MIRVIGKLLKWFVSQPMNFSFSSQKLSSSPATNSFDNIEIQLQDDTGNWRTFHVTKNIPAMIVAGMRQLASQFPNKRIRAVTSEGRIVDML